MNTDYIEKNLNGENISFDDALELFSLPVYELGYMANRIRKERCGDVVGFVIDRNINYTNVCISRCRFCAFYAKNSREAYVLSYNEILRKVAEAVEQDATQIMLQGGINPELGIEWFEGLFREIKRRFEVDIHSLSPPEIVYLARMEGMSVEETISRLRDAGLDSIPGGGAEILSDEIRHKISNKCTSEEWLQVMETAHRLGIKTTATMMFGHVENKKHVVEHLFKIRDLQKRTNGFTAFIPWSFQPGMTELYDLVKEPASPLNYLRIVAISRIVLHNIKNIQVSWLTQGMDIAVLALDFGANDFGGVMLEENVVKATGKEFRPVQVDEIISAIKRAGRIPARRDTYYNIIQFC